MDDNKCEGRSLAEMTKEQRRAFIESLGSDDARAHWEQCEASGIYDRCPKTDWCAKFQEEKKRQERQEVETLRARNQVLEDHARQLEQDFNDYKVTTEARFDKLAGLIQGLMKPKATRASTVASSS